MIKPVIAYAPALEGYGYTAAPCCWMNPPPLRIQPPQLRQQILRLGHPAGSGDSILKRTRCKVLSDIGVSAGKAFAQSCGIPFDPQDTSLTLALGGFTYGVSPLQIAGAYAAFASQGIYNTPTCIQRITDSTGKELYVYEPENRRVMSEQNAYILTSMLQSAIQEGTGHRLKGSGYPLSR